MINITEYENDVRSAFPSLNDDNVVYLKMRIGLLKCNMDIFKLTFEEYLSYQNDINEITKQIEDLKELAKPTIKRI